MLPTQIPVEISLRLMPVSNDLQAIISVTELRVFQVCRCYGIDEQESVSSVWNCQSLKILKNSIHISFNLEFTVFFLD